MSNPLIAQVQDNRQWFTGIGAIEGLDTLISGFNNGSWIEGGLGAAGTALEAASLYWDPIGTLLRWAASWVMEYLEPSRRMLDKLGGNPPVIEAYAATWTNVARAMAKTADDVEAAVSRDLGTWSGDTADTYRAQAAEKVTAMREAAKLCEASGRQTSMVSMLVGAVRTMVREAIAALVAWLVKSIGLTVLTGPFGASEAVRTAVTEIGRVTAMISNTIAKLLRSLANLRGMLPDLLGAFDNVAAKLAPRGARGATDATTPAGAVRPAGAIDTPPRAPDTGTPHAPASDGPTAPSGTAAPDAPGAPRDTSPNGQGTRPASDDGLAGGQRSEGNGRVSARGGDPVDAISGQMITSATDVELPGLLPLVLGRAYASGYRGGRLHGPGWSSTVDQRLEIGANGIGYFGDDAQILLYRQADQVGERIMPMAGERWPLVWDRDADTYRIEDPATGLVRHFGPNAAAPDLRPITALTDRNGNRIDYAHDPAGNPVEVRHSGGYRVGVETADTGGGTRIAALRLLGDDAGTTLAEYRYDERGRLTGIVNPTGLPYRFTYDDADRITAWTDRESYAYRYIYGEDGRVVRGEGDGGYLSADFHYDLDNRVTTVTDSLGRATAYHYDEHHHLTTVVDPLGNAEVTSYDPYHRLLSHTDPLGNTTRYTRDADGLPVGIDRPDGTVVSATYNDLRQPLEVVGPDGASWRYAYDGRGNLCAEIDPAGAVTSYGYDEHGAPRLIVDALGHATTITTNAAGLVRSVTDPGGRTVQYTLDERGRVVAVTDPLGAVTTTEWDPVDQPSRVTYPDGSSRIWRYNGGGDIVELTERGGFTTRFEVGPFHRVTARIDPEGARHTFTHDTELRLTEVVNPQGLRWSYTYDPAGHLTGERDFNGRAVGYACDAAGRLARLTNSAGQTIDLSHDALGRIAAQRTAHGAVTTFGYDPVGRLISAAGSDAEVRVTRDPLGRVLAETVNGRTVTASYDPLGRRVSRTTPSGHTTTWQYDAAGAPTLLTSGSARIAFGYDAAGRETQRQFGANVALTSSWDSMGRLTARQLVGFEGNRAPRMWHSRAWTYRADGVPDSVNDSVSGGQRFDLDRLGRVTAVRAANWTERYTYDASGNITFAGDSRANGSLVAGPRIAEGTLLRQAGRTHFDYDEQGRLTRAMRTTLSGIRQTWLYGYDAKDRLTEVVNPAGQRWRYRYDPLGRRIGKQHLGGNGVPLEEIRFTWDGDALAEQEHIGAGMVTATTWEYEPGTWAPVSQDSRTFYADAPQRVIDAQFHAIVTDLVGTPTELVSPDGRVDWRRDAGLWGNEYRNGNYGSTCLLRFPGQYHDYETGLDYNSHRYYDPETGRYITPDPLGLDPAPNHHGYVDNPLAYVDPLGLAITPDQWARLDRPGWQNYVLRDHTGKAYYSGIFGPTEDVAGVAKRHGANYNRFDPSPARVDPATGQIRGGDWVDVQPGTRTFGEARLREWQLAQDNKTVIGRDGTNYRGNRDRVVDPKKMAKYEEYMHRRTNGGTGCG